MVCSHRLAVEHVKGSPGEKTGADAVRDGFLVYQAAPGAVHQEGSPLAGFEKPAVEQPPGLGGERDVEGDHVGKGESPGQVVQEPDPGTVRLFLRYVGVVGGHLHAEGPAPQGHLGSDPPEADDQKPLSRELHAHEPAPLPFARRHGVPRLGYLPHKGEHHGQSVLRRREGVSGGGVDHHDPPAACRRQVDVVHADTCPGHGPELLRRSEHLPVEGRTAPGQHAVRIGHRLQQFFPGEAEPHFHLELLLLPEQTDSRFRYGIRHEHFHFRHSPSLVQQFQAASEKSGRRSRPHIFPAP